MSRVLPILFNTDMVRAILDGRKNTTRRPIKKSQCDLLFKKDPVYIKWDELREPWHSMTCEEYIKSSYTCPYQPGDTLYVRESWGTYNRNWCESDYFMYRADYPDGATTYAHNEGIICDLPKWHPSIHMPKEAARIWLKVKDVCVERLRDITPDDAVREGTKETFPPLAVDEFRDILDSTIKKSDLERYGWVANPWVWVIEFEQC